MLNLLSASLKQRIKSTYAEYNDGTVELEARFGRVGNQGFVPGVSRQVFNRIRDYFEGKAQSVRTRTTDYISKNIRKTVTNPVGNEAPETIWITKQRLWNQDDNNFGIRYSMSREVPISAVDNFKPEIIREKNRYSYKVFGGAVRIDITMVDMIHLDGSNDRTKYEVEVELMSSAGIDTAPTGSTGPTGSGGSSSFEKSLTLILQRVLDTVILYNSQEANAVIAYVNMLLGSENSPAIDHRVLVQARNLKLKDMVWGGLIGNRSIHSPENQTRDQKDNQKGNGTGYSVTHKADGQRKLLVFHTSGIWLVMAPYSLNRLTNINVPAFTGTILDGELIPKANQLKGAPATGAWYLAFDCLSWSNQDVRNLPHLRRMDYAQAVTDQFKSQVLYVNTKTFRSFNSPQEFFAIMREMFREQRLLSYKQDGLMFTPSNTVYNPHSDDHPLYRRVLTDYPDICKWKPENQLTIDFQIQRKATPTGGVIQLYVNERGRPIPFTGTRDFPFDNYKVDNGHQLTLNLPNETIVEYGWDYERGLFIPHRVRFDKTKPNKIEIANDVWMDIQRPLTQETLEGNTFALLRAYHNKIKSSLFFSGGGTLLDIGSGRGGDVKKWKSYSRIVAIEPNTEHIKELERRLDLYGMRDRVLIVNTGGENTVKIQEAVRSFLGGRADVISMMLSMSFFWHSQAMVKQLVQTIVTNIKPNGKFIFLTIDGDLVEQTFEPAFGTGPIINRLDLGPAKLEYFGEKVPKELHIHIDGTIVEDQTEWLVRLGDLIVPLQEYGFLIELRERADKEKFLTEEEITMTQMYTYGVIGGTGFELPDVPQIFIRPVQKLPEPIKTEPTEAKLTTVVQPPVVVPTTKLLPIITAPFIPTGIPSEVELPMIPVDTYQQLTVTWYLQDPVVRIGAIGNGSCYFHAVLGGYYPRYQNSRDNNFRMDFVQKLRRDIAYTLEMDDPLQPGQTMWETAVNGQFMALYEQQLLGHVFEDDFGQIIDFSLNGLQRLFNSTSYLGDEVYQYASDMLGIDIYIMRLTNKDLYVHLNTAKPDLVRKVVVISGNGNHYETIGVERNGLFQTTFDQNDPFILAIKSLTGR